MKKCKLYFVENGDKKWPDFYKMAESAYNPDLTPMENFMNCCREHDLKITLPIRHPGIKMKRKKRWEGEYLHIPIQGDIETFFIVTTAELF